MSAREQAGSRKSPHADEALTRQGLRMQAQSVACVDEGPCCPFGRHGLMLDATCQLMVVPTLRLPPSGAEC